MCIWMCIQTCFFLTLHSKALSLADGRHWEGVETKPETSFIGSSPHLSFCLPKTEGFMLTVIKKPRKTTVSNFRNPWETLVLSISCQESLVFKSPKVFQVISKIWLFTWLCVLREWDLQMPSLHNLCTYEFILVYVFFLLLSLLARSPVWSKDQYHSFLA